MTSSVPRIVLALCIAAAGLYFGIALARYSEADDAPGGVLIAIVMMIAALGISIWLVRKKA